MNPRRRRHRRIRRSNARKIAWAYEFFDRLPLDTYIGRDGSIVVKFDFIEHKVSNRITKNI